MQYRDIKKLNAKISTFGMGCMRLPLEQGATSASQIDEKLAIEMIHRTIDNGVNYIDTAWPYHGERSEVVVGKALSMDGYRNKTLLATKFPAYIMVYQRYDELKANPAAVTESLIDLQLKKLSTDHIDVYLIHNLEGDRWPMLRAVGLVDILQNMKKKGKIGHIGFSFHDKLENFKGIVDSFDWDMCQIQLNIMDQDYQAGVAGLKYAGSKGIPVAIMEPLRGGSLSANIPPEVDAVWKSSGLDRSHIDWCFRYLCNFPEVMTVLSGVSTMEQAQQNAHMFDDMLPNSLSEAELALIQKVHDIYKTRVKVGCTACGYCMPCPSGVKIPDIFKTYNDASMFGNMPKAYKEYNNLVKKDGDSSHCVRCGKCESDCPQGIDIMDKLQDAAEFLTKK